MSVLEFRSNVLAAYPDVLTPEAVAALEALAPLDAARQEVMRARIATAGRARANTAADRVPRSRPARSRGRASRVQDARDGRFDGSEIPADLQRQWIQGTGPGGAPARTDGDEHPQRRVRAPLGRRRLDVRRRGRARADLDDVARQPAEPEAGDPSRRRVPGAAGQVAGEMNAWARDFFGDRIRQPMIADWQQQLDFTTMIFRARGLHLDDRQVRHADGRGLSASIVDAALYVVNNQARLRGRGSSLVLYLPKIQTAEEAAVWHELLSALERHAGLPPGAIKTYVLVEQIEACFQLMEIRAALGAALRRLQHRPLGLHQQRVRRDGLGWRLRQPEHRRDHDDLRLHAELRGPRPPRRQHAGSARALRALAGRDGTEHPGRLGRRRRGRHEDARSPAPSANSARAPAASGSPTGRWSTSSGPSGSAPARRTSSDARSRRSPTPTPTRPR